MRIRILLLTLCVAALRLQSPALHEPEHSTLKIGDSAPQFCLPGIDGRTHCIQDFASSKVLVIAFICNHCPTSQMYEGRIQRLADDFKNKGVALVAIEPNRPDAVRLDEMGYTDVGDSFEEMKTRAQFRNFTFPYLYDGDTQQVAAAYGPTATPHLFIFDAGRKLRYEGRVDNNLREPLVTAHDARDAINAILSGGTVPGPHTPSIGCSIKWSYKEEGRNNEMANIEKLPVTTKAASGSDLTSLHHNGTGKMLLIDFWATWCGPCRAELPAFETMYRMYGHRAFDLVTVSINYPDEQAGVLKVLTSEHATSTNLVLSSTDIYSALAAFDPEWNAAIPYTLLIGTDGTIIYKAQGATVDALTLKRLIIANLPDDDYLGHHTYWKQAMETNKQ